MGVLILLALIVALFVLAKILWTAGFLAGKDHEAVMWIAAIDKIFVPNWQSLPIGKDEGLNPEELEYANRIYVAAYQTALEHIKLDIASIRGETLKKRKAEQEPGYPV